MNPLHAKILNRCREAVAKELGYSSYEGMKRDWYSELSPPTIIEIEEKAALLAMQEQEEFYRWASKDFVWESRLSCWFSNPTLLSSFSESELYEQWEREKTTTN